MPRQRALTEDQKKQIAMLKNQQLMLQKTEQQCKERGKDTEAKLIEQMKEENKAQAKILIPSITEEDISTAPDTESKKDFDFNKERKSVFDKIKETESEKKVSEEHMEEIVETKDFNGETETLIEADEIPDSDEYFNVKKNDLQFDVIPLPSNGECYPSKISKLSVAYLTAESENMITSPNLYKDDLIIDALLKYHVLNKNVNTDDLLQGDIDAIMLWLRATGYGIEYPVQVKDPSTDETFESVVDLSKIEYKKFTIKADENGFFDFTLPVSKKIIKFKYLSRKEEKQLKLINNLEAEDVRHNLVKDACNTLIEALKYEKKFTNSERMNFEKSIKSMEPWTKIETPTFAVNHFVTNRLEMMVQSIDGNENKGDIHEFITNMPAMDSRKLRKYISDNEPGVDWNTKVKKPESLGGGSMDLFLEWGSDAFLNIS
jgi:hypothetical protein